MPNYMMILHEAPADYSQFSPEDIEGVIGEYIAWRASVEGNGRAISGDKLKDEGGRHLSGFGGDLRVTDGPYAEAKEVIGGFFNIEAADYDDAAKIAGTCPHLKYGGRVELREIENLGE